MSLNAGELAVKMFEAFENSLNGAKDIPFHEIRKTAISRFSEIGFPGRRHEEWKYSNVAVGLLGHVIEAISGLPYEQYIFEEITGPLGLLNTRLELDSDQVGLKATGYSRPVPGSDDLREAPYSSLLGI